MQILIGFGIALLMGLTGIGGGSFTTPALVLTAGLSGAEAVGTALVFSTIVRLTAAPFYLAGKHIHLRYLRLMLLGAVPGLLGGTYLLSSFNSRRWNPVILVVIGTILIGSSLLTFFYRNARPSTRADAPAWLPWLTLPIGVETGFSSAGAGALGTILLFNCSDMPAAKIVGTDLVFGTVLAAAGSVLHLGLGSISGPALKALLVGGIPGVLAGSALAPKVPSNRLRMAIIALTFLLGLQLVWSGVHLIH
ncbi:MAG TPA: sulfite exporter TauE/SafE family protein [Candidatus Angelobacter sp.]